MCLLLANQNIFDAWDCSGSFEIFLLSVASSHSFLFLSLGCVSDLLCHLPQTGSAYSPPGRRAWCRILISLMEVLVCNVGLMLVHTALLSLLPPPQFSSRHSPSPSHQTPLTLSWKTIHHTSGCTMAIHPIRSPGSLWNSGSKGY